MIKLIVIVVVYILYWLIEVNHDDILRQKENALRALMRLYAKVNKSYEPNYGEETKQVSKWHSLDWKGHALLGLLVGYLAATVFWLIPIYALVIASLRVLILNIGGNIKVRSTGSDRGIFYVGDRGIESKFKKKEILYYILWLAILVVSLYSIIRFGL